MSVIEAYKRVVDLTTPDSTGSLISPEEFSAKLPFYLMGFTSGFEGVDPIATFIIGSKAKSYMRKNETVIDGRLPKDGAVILAGNHRDKGDSYKTFMAGWAVGRITTRVIVKASLVDPNGMESEEFLASLGNRQEEYSEYDKYTAWVLKRAGVIPHRRDKKPTRDFLRTCDQVINSGGLLGVYMMQTRNSEGLLANLQEGAAFFAKKHPDTLVQPMAFSGPPNGRRDRLTIPRPFTYNQKRDQLGRDISVGEFTVIIGDAIAEGLPSEAWLDWQNRRPEELARLTASSHRPAA